MKGVVCSFILTAFTAIAAADGGAVLWRDSGVVESLDLSAGPGGRDKAPQPPFTFVNEDTTGTSPKVTVRDGRGAIWSVKFGPEVKAESFATRFVWAAGYFAEPTYFVPQGTIQGASSLSRAGHYIQNGRFRDARFELRDESVYRLINGSKWSMDDSAVKGTKELTGLKLTTMLLGNWDVKSDNMSIVESGGHRYFAVTDWGASMGAAQDMTGRSKWDCDGFKKQSEHFVQDVDNGYVTIDYSGKERHVITNNIRVDDVKWYMNRMSKLTDAQVRAGLQASGATAQEAACFTEALRKRLSQLAAVASGSWNSRTITTTTTRTVTKTTTTTTEPPKK
jgi:hypothetical protein